MQAGRLRLFVALNLFLILRILGVNFVNASAIRSPIHRGIATLATIPTSCNDTCNAIETTIINCDTTAACLCTSSNEASLESCVDCLEAVKPANQSVIALAQSILTQYAEICDAEGVSVPVETASGFTGSVGIPSGATSPLGLGTFSPGFTSIGSGPGPVSTNPTGVPTSGALTSAANSPSLSTIGGSTHTVTIASSLTSPPSSSTAPSSAANVSSTTASTSGVAEMGPSARIGFLGSLTVGLLVSVLF